MSLESGPAGASLSGQTTVKAAQGMASFSGLTIDKAGGNDVMQVAVDGVGSITTSPFQVVPAAPSQLVIVDQPPSQLVAGRSFGVTVAAEDHYGNTVAGFNNAVTVALANGPAGSVLSGVDSADAVNGVASVTGLALDRAGAGYRVQAASDGMTSSASTAMTVAPAAPSRLVITLQPPASVVARQPFAVNIEAEDSYGNLATAFDGTVTAALASNPNRDILEGTLSVPASGGLAVVADAALKKPGKSYAITITSNGLTPAMTSVFNVVKPGDRKGHATAVRRPSHPRFRDPVGASERGSDSGRATKHRHQPMSERRRGLRP